MRRKIKLKVLYWPIFASIAIIIILFAFSPGGESLRARWQRLSLTGNLWKTLAAWIPAGDRGHDKQAYGARPLPSPRTLAQKGTASDYTTKQSVDIRGDLESSARPRAIHSPHALRAELAAPMDLVAEAKLLAPRLNLDEELAGVDRVPQQTAQLASLSRDSNLDDEDADQADTAANGLAPNRPSERHGLGGGWPDTPQLIAELDTLARVAKGRSTGMLVSVDSAVQPMDIEHWQQAVLEQLTALRRLASVSSPEAGDILQRLQALAQAGHAQGEQLEDRELQIRMLRTTHGLDRRLAVWGAVWRTTQGTVLRVSDLGPDGDEQAIDRAEVSRLVSTLRAETLSTPDEEGWLQFLLLNDVESANVQGDPAARRMTAQRFLSRLMWHRLSDEHRAWLDRETIRSLSIVMRRWAATPMDFASLLAQIERQESDAIDLGAIDVASAVQAMRFAESREANRTAEALNTYYRNANARIAISSEFISRLIPEVDARVQPVRDRILGADVRGTSVAHSKLALRLIPSPNTWRMELETHGLIETGAASRQWPVLIRSRSEASFLSSTPLEISRDGSLVGSTQVDVDSKTRVRGVNTDFDSIPIVNTLVREIALDRYNSMAPVAKRIQNSKIRRGLVNEVDGKLTEQLDKAASEMTQRLTGPLTSLKLNPMVVDMQTTESRLLTRYRVAGDWQLAAFTPRPRAPQTSLMSMQLHQSAFNNTLETILPSGEPKTIKQLVDDVRGLFGIEKSLVVDADEDIPADITIQFASTRPITVEIEDDILWITMRVIRLKQGRSLDLRRFIVRAGYRPEVDGMSAKLVREGHLRISGPEMSMRERLPVRAIFNKVFSTRRSLPLISEQWANHPAMSGLAVTQAELRDGWLALAIGDPNDGQVTPQIARQVDEDDSVPSHAF